MLKMAITLTPLRNGQHPKQVFNMILQNNNENIS